MNLLDQLHRHATDRPHHPALHECCTAKTFTYQQLYLAVSEFAATLRTHGPHSTWLLKSPNRAEFHIAFLASLSAGHAIFPISPDIADTELHHAAQHSGACGIIDSNLTITLFPSLPSPAQARDLLLQSSGTTALPKIVARPSLAIDASAHQIVESMGLTPKEKILACVPLSHSYGLEHGLLAPIYAGATTYLAPGFDISLIARELLASNIAIFPGVPTVFELLTTFHDLPKSFPHLNLVYSAGGPLPQTINHAFFARFNLHIGQIYGATEFGSITFSDPRAADFNPASVGRPMPGVELKLDSDSQLLVRAQSLLREYLDAESPLTPDGFFPTGDLANIDPTGQLTLTGRLKLLIDIAGRKVNPLEVEAVLSRHPGIAQCAVISIPQTETLRRLKAILVPKISASPPTTEELRQFLKPHLSPYKIPRVFEYRTDLPRSSAGKILRNALEAP